MVLRFLTFAQPGASSRRTVALWGNATRPRSTAVSDFAVSAHDTSSRCYAGIKHGLHDLLLVTTCRQPDTKTLPIAASPFRLLGQS